ncbi:MAG: hypothetical protein Q8936_00775 [Bacillota bacterium]|nr:hypothetical protein [Bacillota bacterium]
MFKNLISVITKPKVYFALWVSVIFLVILPNFTKAPIGPYAFKQHANDMQMIDMVINYSPEEAYRLIAGYGESGRRYYIIQSLTLDLAIPLCLMLLVMASIKLIYRQTFFKNYMHKFMIIPFLGFLCDYSENACVITMIINYPKRLNNLAVISNIFTISKWIFCTLGILIVLVGLIYIGINTCLRNKHSKI